MRTFRWFKVMAIAIVVLATVIGSGCGNSDTKLPPADGAKAPVAPTTEKPKSPLVPKQQIVDWCREHAVPESICTRCNDQLIPGFKEKKDWCNEHNLPESQCIKCNPALEAKFKAMAPKTTE